MKFTEARRHRQQMTAANEAGPIRNAFYLVSSVAPTFFNEDVKLKCHVDYPDRKEFTLPRLYHPNG
jgi:hypothetical protein